MTGGEQYKRVNDNLMTTVFKTLSSCNFADPLDPPLDWNWLDVDGNQNSVATSTIFKQIAVAERVNENRRNLNKEK